MDDQTGLLSGQKQDENQFRTIFDNAADAIFIAEIETGIIIDTNFAAERLLKMPKSLLIGRHQAQLHPPSSSQFSTDTFGQHINEIEARNFTDPIENIVVDADGNQIPVEILASKVFFKGKECLMGTFRNISERKRVENELLLAKKNIEESEYKFRAAFFTSPDSININKLNGEYVEINDGFTRLTGYTKEEVIGKLSSEIQIWAIPEDRKKLIVGLQNDGLVENLESLFRAKNGELIPGLMSARLIRLNSEPHILSVTRAISERKKFENELIKAKEKAEENEEKLFAFINSIPDIVCYKDPEGRWLLANDADLKIFGLQGVDYHGKTDYDLSFFTHDLYKEAFRFCMETDEIAWQKRTISKGVEIIPTAEGEKKVFDMYKIPLFFPDGERKGLAVIGREITELYQTQQSLTLAKELAEESEKKFKQIAENSDEAFWLRTDKQFLYINPAFEKIFGYKCEEAIANPGIFLEMIHPDDKPKVLAIMAAEEYKKFGLFNHEYRIIRPDNEVRWVLSKGTPIFNAKGEMERRLGFASDITERKQAEIEIKIAKERAEESDRLKTAFIQNMSHEIRTPMNAIMGFSELLPKNFDNKTKLEHYSEIINNRSGDLLKIINDLLDIAKIESGQMTAFVEEFNVKELFAELRETFGLHQKKIKKLNISFDYRIDPKIEDLILRTDKLKLTQIFSNLISNAFKFTETGKIEFGCELQYDKTILFYVSDTGIGVPKSKFQQIFKRFAQLNAEGKRNYGGNGLGLSIVKGLLELLGGKIWIESEENKGTTFYFTIESKEANMPHNLKEFADRLPDNSPIKNKVILIVEDDPFNSALFEEIFSGYGANLTFAVTGEEAVSLALELLPDIILMDIRLPDMPGYDAISKILSLKPDSKIIAQTAYATNEDRARALKLGCVDYISKPLKEEKLIAMVSKHLHSK